VVQPVAAVTIPNDSGVGDDNGTMMSEATAEGGARRLVLPHACGPITRLIARTVAEGFGCRTSEELV
jgi:hypothetical protein